MSSVDDTIQRDLDVSEFPISVPSTTLSDLLTSAVEEEYISTQASSAICE